MIYRGPCTHRLLSVLAVTLVYLSLTSTCSREVLTNQWLVELDGDGGIEAAKLVAKRTGFTYVAPVSIQPHPAISIKLKIM